jgi:hypothetical protein
MKNVLFFPRREMFAMEINFSFLSSSEWAGEGAEEAAELMEMKAAKVRRKSFSSSGLIPLPFLAQASDPPGSPCARNSPVATTASVPAQARGSLKGLGFFEAFLEEPSYAALEPSLLLSRGARVLEELSSESFPASRVVSKPERIREALRGKYIENRRRGSRRDGSESS